MVGGGGGESLFPIPFTPGPNPFQSNYPLNPVKCSAKSHVTCRFTMHNIPGGSRLQTSFLGVEHEWQQNLRVTAVQYLLFLHDGIPEVYSKLPDIDKPVLVSQVIIQTKYLHKRVLHEGDYRPGLGRHELCILHKIHVQLLKM